MIRKMLHYANAIGPSPARLKAVDLSPKSGRGENHYSTNSQLSEQYWG